MFPRVDRLRALRGVTRSEKEPIIAGYGQLYEECARELALFGTRANGPAGLPGLRGCSKSPDLRLELSFSLIAAI